MFQVTRPVIHLSKPGSVLTLPETLSLSEAKIPQTANEFISDKDSHFLTTVASELA